MSCSNTTLGIRANDLAFRTVRGHVAMVVAGGCGDWYQVPVSMNRFVAVLGMPVDEESVSNDNDSPWRKWVAGRTHGP
jgi:hypothetical protein